jgi:hypothetical protein
MCVAGSRKARPSTNRSGPNILATFGRKTGGWGRGGEYYPRPSLPISIKQEGVRIRVKQEECFHCWQNMKDTWAKNLYKEVGID